MPSKRITMFESHQKGAFKLTFDNGTQVSVIWKPGSYSDNHDIPQKPSGDFDEDVLMGTDDKFCTSKTAEVMIVNDPTGKAAPFVENNYSGNPAGYLTVDDVLDIFNYVRVLN